MQAQRPILPRMDSCAKVSAVILSPFSCSAALRCPALRPSLCIYLPTPELISSLPTPRELFHFQLELLLRFD
ncbi:hypothetical protein BJY01DRAFT_209175 [Aspergillus pseudoustus]|uniref:Uncharacterized protein n=1 Tax=Aspergillus pseudoustus TaxID=1810923 RepID=A0ABR4KGY0_9EURO